MRSKISGKTKEENKEFDNEEVTGEFMERYVEGVKSEKSVLFGADKKGEINNRDSLAKGIWKALSWKTTGGVMDEREKELPSNRGFQRPSGQGKDLS